MNSACVLERQAHPRGSEMNVLAAAAKVRYDPLMRLGCVYLCYEYLSFYANWGVTGVVVFALRRKEGKQSKAAQCSPST